MPMHEQLIRREQDPFHKPESEPESERESKAAETHRRLDAEEQRVAEEERTHNELLAPSVVAELPRRTEVSEEAVKRLFNHFSERQRKGDLTPEEAARTSATQIDPRTTAQAQTRDPRGKMRPDNERADEFPDGIAADFVTDSQGAVGALDERPRDNAAFDNNVDVWEGTPGRKRKRRGAPAPAKAKKREGSG
jgi:hypothetical protein